MFSEMWNKKVLLVVLQNARLERSLETNSAAAQRVPKLQEEVCAYFDLASYVEGMLKVLVVL